MITWSKAWEESFDDVKKYVDFKGKGIFEINKKGIELSDKLIDKYNHENAYYIDNFGSELCKNDDKTRLYLIQKHCAIMYIERKLIEQSNTEEEIKKAKFNKTIKIIIKDFMLMIVYYFISYFLSLIININLNLILIIVLTIGISIEKLIEYYSK